jgi:CDP-diglyceride synthetase
VAAFEVARAALPNASPSVPISAAVGAARLVALARTQDWFEVGTLIPTVALVLLIVLRSEPPASPLEMRTPAPDGGTTGRAVSWWLVAVAYPGVLGAHFVLLRLLPEGQTWLLVLLAATFATDSGAYAVGHLWGRHKLAPSISPGKTREGAAGGFVAGGLAVVASTFLTDAPPEATVVAVIALALPLLAQAGDLLESALKRKLEVKDMSRLLPGHGGVMDRLDSLLATGPALYWLVRWLG